MVTMANHFDSLLPQFQVILSLAALFEEESSIDWIVELTEKKASQVILAMEEGIRQGWVKRKEPGIFFFADLKMRERLIANLAAEKKEQLQRRCVDLLIRELPENDLKDLTIGRHLLYTVGDVDSCRWLLRAGDSLRRAYRSEEALQYYTKILNDLSGATGEAGDELFIEAAIKYSKISTARQNTQKVLSMLQEAIIRAKRWSKQTSLALLQMHLAKSYWLRSRYRKALRHFEEGWSISKDLDDPKLLRSATTFSIFFLFWQGRFREAVQFYEKSVPDVEKFPQGRFPLLALLTVARCYVQTGQVTQGLGMLDALHAKCRQIGDIYLAANAGVAIGLTMLEINRIDEALQYLKRSLKEAAQAHNEWIRIEGKLLLAFAYYLNGDNQRSVACLKEFLQESSHVHVIVRPFPHLMELCWAMEDGRLPNPNIPGLSLKKEIDQAIIGEHVFMKGAAYRYQALLQRREGLPHERVFQSLNLSLKWLEESGSLLEKAQSQMELAREYLLAEDDEKAKGMTMMASKILSSFNEAPLPDDLKFLINDPSLNGNLLKDILRLAQELVVIRDNKDLVQHIISRANQITGAERGAIFLLNDDQHSPKLRVRASKNLTSEQITDSGFDSSMKLIEEVAFTGKGRVLGMSSISNLSLPPGGIIRSRICVPMILRDKVVGVLYHDNRLLHSHSKESDLELLAYFAAQAAFALDNAKAYEEIQRLNQNLREEKLYFEEQHLQSIHFEGIIGESPAIIHVLNQVAQVASTDATVLITGETGVGKELVARAIHRQSPRRDKPFIQVHCSALPETLIPSELFGHEKGAFTGAISRRIGRFELANGGSIFLDEIADLSLEVQARLLRVLQSKEFERVGASETIRSDFRLLAATNRNFEQEVKALKFREDLYYRLNVFPIRVPPLRERREDIPLIAYYFLKIYASKMGKTFGRIPESEMDKLINYNWPGNVRELENVVERSVILSTAPNYRLPELGNPEFAHPIANYTLKENEYRHVLWALQKSGWKVRGIGGTAELLDIHPSTLIFRMKKLGIRRPPKFSQRGRKPGRRVFEH